MSEDNEYNAPTAKYNKKVQCDFDHQDKSNDINTKISSLEAQIFRMKNVIQDQATKIEM
jgi:hypothetical protein